MTMDRELQELERQSASLRMTAADRRQALGQAQAHAEQFLESLPKRRVYEEAGPRGVAMQELAISARPADISVALQVLDDHVDGVGHNLGSERFFAYIPSGGLYASAVGDYLAAVSNRYAGVGAAAPGATRMEHVLLRWLADVVGYPDTAEGDLTSGGSMATLSAVVAAREAAGIVPTAVENSVCYLTDRTHHTFSKALHVAGLGHCIVRKVPLDVRQRMDGDALAAAIAADRENGLRPWLVVATAGTTDTGAVDPLPFIADLCAKEDVWMHVDAAYGGAFALSESGKARLAGIERSNSLVLDPHKGFFLPCGTGVVLVRNGQQLYDAYHARGAYMQDVAGDTERSPCDYSAELTRPFRALRFWLPFKVHGSDAFAAALQEKLLLAEYFYERVGDIDGIVRGPHPDLSIVTFRYTGGTGSDNEASRELLRLLHEDGRVFLTSTTIEGRFTIRMAILTYHTHKADIDLALEVIRDCVDKMPS